MPTAGMASRHDRTGHLPAGAEARLTTHGAQVPVGLPGELTKLPQIRAFPTGGEVSPRSNCVRRSHRLDRSFRENLGDG